MWNYYFSEFEKCNLFLWLLFYIIFRNQCNMLICSFLSVFDKEIFKRTAFIWLVLIILLCSWLKRKKDILTVSYLTVMHLIKSFHMIKNLLQEIEKTSTFSHTSSVRRSRMIQCTFKVCLYVCDWPALEFISSFSDSVPFWLPWMLFMAISFIFWSFIASAMAAAVRPVEHTHTHTHTQRERERGKCTW